MLTRSKTRRLSARSAWSIPPRDMQPVAEMVGHRIQLDRNTEWLECGDFWQLDECCGMPNEPSVWVVPGDLVPWNGKFSSITKHHAMLVTQCPFTLLMVDPSAMKYIQDNFEITHNPARWAHYALEMLPWSCYHAPTRLTTPDAMPNYPGTRFIRRYPWHKAIPRHPEKPVLYMNICDWASLFGRVCSDGTVRCD